MASLVQEEMSFEERGQMVERIVQNAYDFFRGGLVAKWNRVVLTWYEGGLPRHAITIKDYFSAEPYTSQTVQFSPALQAFILTRIRLPAGITFDTLIDNDIPKDPRTNLLNFNMERGPKSSLLAVVQRRFRDRLEGEEYSMRNDTPANEKWKMPVESRAPTPTPRDDRAYFEDTGFESVDLIEKELKKIYRHGLEPVGQLTMEDKREIQAIRDRIFFEKDGAYEEGKIREVDKRIKEEEDEIKEIEDHGNLSKDERVLLLRKIDDRNLNEDEQEFLEEYMEYNGFDDWDEAYAGAKYAVEDEDEPQTGAAIIAHDKAKIRTLREERAEWERQATVTEVVSVLMSDGTTTDNRTYQGTEAIRSAKQKNLRIQGKLKSRARDVPNREQIEALQNKLRFATAFYEGIDKIFKADDSVPLTHEWRENNYRSPLVGYVVWGMANPQPGVDRLLFKPQATLVRRLIRTRPQPSVREIQYMILTDRLGQNLNVQDILDVTKEQADAYKNRLLGMSPKRDQKPAAVPGTVEKNPKRKGPKSNNPRDQKPGGRKPGLKIQTKLTDGGFEPDGNKAEPRGRSRRAAGVPNRRPSRSPPLRTFGFKSTKPFSPDGGGDKKIRARSSTPPVERGSSSNRMDTGDMLNKLNLKF